MSTELMEKTDTGAMGDTRLARVVEMKRWLERTQRSTPVRGYAPYVPRHRAEPRES